MLGRASSAHPAAAASVEARSARGAARLKNWSIMRMRSRHHSPATNAVHPGLGCGCRLRRTNPDMIPKRLFTAAIVLGIGLNLASCGGFVADHWPHWAGGLPADAPPRPGTPGYAEFVSHGQAKPEAVNTATPQPPVAAAANTLAPAAPTAVPLRQAPAAPTGAAPPNDDVPEDSSVVKGGLY